MLSAPLEPVLGFLEKHHARLEVIDFRLHELEFPGYKLMPYDYLEYARAELDLNTVSSKINCVAHLKRAVECELDTILYLLGLRAPKRNFPAKMEFVRAAGLLSNRSLETLNRYRNKAEHDYDAPDGADLDLYFDLAETFVLALEGYIFMLKESPGIALGFHDYSVPYIGVMQEPRLAVSVETKDPRIIFELRDEGERCEIIASGKDFLFYGEALGVLLLLVRSTSLISLEYVIAQLRGTRKHGTSKGKVGG